MLLSIITLNYKKKDLTINCLNSLYEQYKKEFEAHDIELIIVDNNSQDDSVSAIRGEIAKHHYKNVHLIANPDNSGFGAGNNVGVKSAKGKQILFLNNDTIVKDHGLIKMAEYLESHEEVAILGGQLRNFDGSLQPCVGNFYTPLNTVLLLIGGQRLGLLDRTPKNIEKVDWVKGGLMMIRRSVFNELGGFDEKIFMYIEDMELCYRAHLARKQTYFYPDVMVLHKEHGSANKTFAIVHIYKNLLYFYKKHRTHSEYLFVKSLLVAKAKSLIAAGKMTKNAYLVETYEKALAGLQE